MALIGNISGRNHQVGIRFTMGPHLDGGVRRVSGWLLIVRLENIAE